MESKFRSVKHSGTTGRAPMYELDRKFNLAVQYMGNMYHGTEIKPGLLVECLNTDNILFTGNSNLYWNHFLLKDNDYEPIGNFKLAGKSATIDWIGGGNTKLTMDEKDYLSRTIFHKAHEKEIFYYTISIPDLKSLGFNVYTTETRSNPLHVSVVHQVTLDNPRDRRVNIPTSSLQALVVALNSGKR